MWPRRNVLSRFAGYVEPCVPVDLMTLPSGFAQVVTGAGETSPVLVNADPTVGSFIRSASLPPFQIHNQYLPTYTRSGIVGGGLFGPGPIGYRIAYHGKLIATVVNGFTIYEPEAGGDQRK